MFLHSLRLSYMQKIGKFYRAVFREKGGETDRQRDRQRDRQTERDGPEFKGPPDAIAKPSDQKNDNINNIIMAMIYFETISYTECSTSSPVVCLVCTE